MTVTQKLDPKRAEYELLGECYVGGQLRPKGYKAKLRDDQAKRLRDANLIK